MQIDISQAVKELLDLFIPNTDTGVIVMIAVLCLIATIVAKRNWIKKKFKILKKWRKQ